MPFSIRKIGKNKYQVYNTATGEIHSKGTTKKKAEGQFRLLQGIARKEVIGLEGGALDDADTMKLALVGSITIPLVIFLCVIFGQDRARELYDDIVDRLDDLLHPNNQVHPEPVEAEAIIPQAIAHYNALPPLARVRVVEQGLRDASIVADALSDIEEGRDASAVDTDDSEETIGTGRGLKGGKKWNFSNRNYNPLTLGYNALLNGMTENYRSDITKEGVRQDVDRNIEQAKKFAKNPNPVAFAKNEAEGQFSRYGSGYPANPSDYQPRRFL